MLLKSTDIIVNCNYIYPSAIDDKMFAVISIYGFVIYIVPD